MASEDEINQEYDIHRRGQCFKKEGGVECVEC